MSSVGLCVLGAMPVSVFSEGAAGEGTNLDVLVFSKTEGFRHPSIPDGIASIESLGSQVGFTVVASEDASLFDDATLSQFAAVVFLNTTGDILDTAQQEAFERYIQNGGGWVGVHSAADTEYDWPWCLRVDR